MKYKGYEGAVKFNEEADIFHGEVIGTRDVITFQGTSVKELQKAFRDSIDDYLPFLSHAYYWVLAEPFFSNDK